ncbi:MULTISPECIES: hypothetical protein [Vibrio]|uniref:hypothetical protein n=1 Tax=Vibrio TaxID=662 RepID=UPI002075F07D|nr:MULTISPECIES: hypothetical protein [Vibrio]USD35505.1 hypothetical protein J8Z27_23075 [Vibrio sp. SCSIO 43186]USD72629.1 hypothetical protein J4N41_23080 [Vibrio sp. SCSIO 43139]USD99020.1 hypothetical protein CTT30_23390 [Vibrio coralliilyticus]
MLNMTNIGKLGQLPHNTELFVGVIRDANALARADNPNLSHDDSEYQAARDAFITDLTSNYEGQQVPTCKNCTMEMAEGFHIHHKDGNHTNNKPDNFEINCPFCHYTYHLGWVGANSLGTMIYAPSIPQATLNQIQAICYAHEYIINATPKKAAHYSKLKQQSHGLNTLIQSLEAMKAVIQRDFKTTSPEHFANAFMRMSEDEYANRAVGTFSGIRLLYDKTQFQGEIEMFAKHSLSMNDISSPNNPAQWVAQAKQLK